MDTVYCRKEPAGAASDGPPRCISMPSQDGNSPFSRSASGHTGSR